MADAGLDVQTGYHGWGAVSRGRKPVFRDFAPRGSFRWVRQPVYVAFALTLWTGPVWTIDHLLIASVWTIYCVLAPRHKERRYSQRYGERFTHYRGLVPYWIPRRRPADLSTLAGIARDTTLAGVARDSALASVARDSTPAGVTRDVTNPRVARASHS
jgi:hypothetical protein